MEQLPDINPNFTATKQAVNGRDSRGRFVCGNKPKTGFHTNPERRSNGSWKKASTVRGKFEALLNEASVGEFFAQIGNNNIDNAEEKLGDVAISQRLRNTFIITADGHLEVISKEFDKLMTFVYGTKVDNDLQIDSKHDDVILRGFVIPAIDPANMQDIS